MTVATDPLPNFPKTLSAPETCSVTGVTYRQIDYWERIGVIEPFIPANGSGSQRRFTLHQVAVLRCLGQLAAAGAGAIQLKNAWDHLTRLTVRQWHGKLYISPAGFVSTKLTGPVALALNLERTREEMLIASHAAVAESAFDG